MNYSETKRSFKELRARANETQFETASAIGVSQQSYGKWEKDPLSIKVANLVKLAQHFDVSIDDIKFF